MTDTGFSPEREDEEMPRMESDGLLPDSGFDLPLFDTPTDQTPREGGTISEETMFPADPVFFSDLEGEAEDESEAAQLPSFSELELSEKALCTTEPPEQSEPGAELLDDAGALFDPITPSDASQAEPHRTDLDSSSELFYVPESESVSAMTTAAFYAASELPGESEASAASGETEAPASSQECGRAAGKKSVKAKPRKARPVRELTEQELYARRQDAEVRIASAKRRFCFAVLLSLLLTVVEIFPSFGLYITRPLGISRIAGADALLDLQLLLLIALCAYRTVSVGIRSVLSGRLRYEGILVILLLLFAAYDTALYALGIRHALLCALALAVSLCACVWIEMNEGRVELGILTLLCESKGVSAALSLDGKKRLRVTRLLHADGFDEHIGDYEENAHSRFLLLLGMLSVATLALIFAVVFGGYSHPIGVGLAAALLALPSGALLARRLYLTAMQKALLLRQIALIGESAAYSAASHDVFSIDDTEAFDPQDVKIKMINVFGDFRLDEAVRLIAGVYRPLGGALAEVLSRMCDEAGGPHDLELTYVSELGAVASDGTRTVAVGMRAFMCQNSIVFPDDAREESLLTGHQLMPLYCAVDGRVVARMLVEYTLSRGFEDLADQLARLGARVELRTADPCLSEEYLLRLSSLPRGVLSLCRVEEKELLSEKCTRAECGFFTTDRPRSLVGAWLAFRRYLAVRRHGEALSVLQLLLGGAMLGVSVFCFGAPLVPISLTALYQLAAILIALGGSRAFSAGLVADSPDFDPDTQPKGPEL